MSQNNNVWASECTTTNKTVHTVNNNHNLNQRTIG